MQQRASKAICEGVLWSCEVHRSRLPFLHRPMCAFDPLSRFLMLPLLPKFMSEQGVTTLLNMCSSLPTSGTYVLGAIVVLQPNHAVEQHEVLRHVALSAVIAVAAAVAHTSPAEQLPNAFLFASSGCTAPQPPAGRPRRPPGTACGLERPGAPSSFRLC